ncbi:hypothetical protein ACVIGB_007992 [Bradyrhizobium sp. USDA 4341]
MTGQEEPKKAGDHPQGGDYRAKIKLHISGAFAGEGLQGD